MLKINTEKELYDFLKVLSEESVKKSKEMLNESADPFVSSYEVERKKRARNVF